jgi:hypothetical protein
LVISLAALAAAELVGFFGEPLQADLPGEDLVAVERVVALEELAAPGRVVGVGEGGCPVPGGGEAGVLSCQIQEP